MFTLRIENPQVQETLPQEPAPPHPGRRPPSHQPEEKPKQRQCLAEFPALQANKGFAWLVFLTSRFTIREVMGASAVLCPAKEEQELAAGIIH